MRPVAIVSLLALLLTVAPSAQADETWSITGAATVSGNSGLVMEIAEIGFPVFEFHTFVEAGKHRVFAEREQPATLWDLKTPAVYLVPTATMNINDTWNSFPTENTASPTTATVKALESVTVGAGTFTAYRVEVGLASNPSTLDAVFWFVDGVGIVRQDFYDVDAPGNPFDLREELAAFTIVGGSGFLPAAVGNSWNYSVIVANEDSSWGSVKALYVE
jgi:DUF3108-like